MKLKHGILTLHNVQAGTHVIYFQLIKYSDSSMKEGFEVYSTNTLFEVVPSKIRRFYPPNSSVISVVSEKLEVSGVLDSQNKRVEGLLVQGSNIKSFAHGYGLGELTKLYREKRMKKYRNKSKIRMAFVGTLILDGQKTIWMEQWKKLVSAYEDMFDITYYCFRMCKRSGGTTVEVSIFFQHTVFANRAFRSGVKHVF